MSPEMIQPTAVALAAERLAGVVNKTPVMTSRTLDNLVGRNVYLKCENFQRAGAFKFRGAFNAVSQLSADEKAAGVITHSSGNHAQGLALAAKLLGVEATIVMPHDAPVIKREATAAYGARIIFCQAIERENVCAEQVARHGYKLIHPYDNDQIIAGAGTAAWELFSEIGNLDTLIVPVGGGGLISGSALAAAARSPGCRVVGVEPELAADAGRSWRENKIVSLDHVPTTIADGLRTRYIGERNLAIMRRYVSDMISISEEEIKKALEFLWLRMKIVVEPSAAVALAPLLSAGYTNVGSRVGLLLSGGNVDAWQYHAGQGQGSESYYPRSMFPYDEAEPVRPSPGRVSSRARPRVLIADPMDETGLEILRIVSDPIQKPQLTQDELSTEIGNYEAVVVGPERQITEQMIEYGFGLRAIGVLSSRLDGIDVSTARNLGIQVCNAPGSRAVAISEHTMARLLRLTAEFGQGRLAGETLGIVGFGRIGQLVAQRAQAFEMKVIVNQPRLTPQLALSAGVELVGLKELLDRADFVSLHVSRKAETDAILGAEELGLMKPTAFLINAGHTELVDEAALLQALEERRIAAAALSIPPSQSQQNEVSRRLRQHENVLVSPHVTAIIETHAHEAAVAVAEQLVEILQADQPDESLSLELVKIDQVVPHEQIDEKRVTRLMARLEQDGRLVNPPVTIRWHDHYVILDGATRYSALKRLGYPHVVIQVVPPGQQGFELHTWYHAISSEEPFATFLSRIRNIEHLNLERLQGPRSRFDLEHPDVLCHFLDRDGNTIVARVQEGGERLAVMNALVDNYSEWGTVERTLLTDLPRLKAQFPRLAAVAIFPQFSPEAVFEAASQGDLLPAGLTRFVIPGRVLRLNADLHRLKQDEPLIAKRAWFNRFLEDKLARSRLRFYQEPVILLDE